MKSPVALAAVLLSVTALTASAQTVKVEFLMGKVNLKVQNASLRAVLTEWARVGGTKIVNPERLAGQPVTLELVGVPERQALDILMRDVGGFMLGPRQSLVPGVSAYDRIVVVSGAAPRPTVTLRRSTRPRSLFAARHLRKCNRRTTTLMRMTTMWTVPCPLGPPAPRHARDNRGCSHRAWRRCPR